MVGIDLDCCRDVETGAVTPVAQAIVDRIASYTEVFPSGTGVKIFLLAGLEINRRTRGVEVYSNRRYFTVTGHHLPGTAVDLQERSLELRRMCNDLFGSTWAGDSTAEVDTIQVIDTDSELLERARNAANGKKFEALFAGRWQGRYPSQSEADLALCRMLAFWTRSDGDRIDRLFRQSGLMRPKWDDTRGGSTYGRKTVSVVLA